MLVHLTGIEIHQQRKHQTPTAVATSTYIATSFLTTHPADNAPFLHQTQLPRNDLCILPPPTSPRHSPRPNKQTQIPPSHRHSNPILRCSHHTPRCPGTSTHGHGQNSRLSPPLHPKCTHGGFLQTKGGDFNPLSHERVGISNPFHGADTRGFSFQFE